MTKERVKIVLQSIQCLRIKNKIVKLIMIFKITNLIKLVLLFVWVSLI